MPETSIVERIYKRKPFTGRLVGRPNSRWQDDVRNNLKKVKLIKWAEQDQDRLHGRIWLRRPRLYQRCSAIEEEEGEEEEDEEDDDEEEDEEEEVLPLRVCSGAFSVHKLGEFVLLHA